MKYGYLKLSKQDRNYELQLAALTGAGCDKIFTEKITGTDSERPELIKLMNTLVKEDTLIVWRLNHLNGDVKELIRLLNDFYKRGIQFISISPKIDTSKPSGRSFFQIIASLSELELETKRARTEVGLDSTRARGRKGGRPRGLSTEAQVKAKTVYQLYRAKELSISEILQQTGISLGTLYAYIRFEQEKIKLKEKISLDEKG